MKKTYEKPQIYMERFELAEHIASGCGTPVLLRDEASCFDILNGMFYENLKCGNPVPPDKVEDYGYWANTLFTS